MVLADARSIHTERYVAELRRQGCEVLLASLEGQSPCEGQRGFHVREEKGFDRCEEWQDHKGPDLQEEKVWTPCQARGDREGGRGDSVSAVPSSYVRLRRRFPISTVAYALAAGEVERLIEEWRPEVISAHYASGYGFLASRLRRRGFVRSRRRIPLTLHVWGSDVLVVPGKSWLHRMKVVRGIRAADHVFSDSRYLAEATRRLVRGAEVSVYPWGIERRYLALHKSEYAMGRPMRVIVPRMHEPVYDNEFVVEALREEIEKGVVRVVFPAFGSGYVRFCRRVRELGLEVREVGEGGQGQESSGRGEVEMGSGARGEGGPTINGGPPEEGNAGHGRAGCQDHKGPDLREEGGVAGQAGRCQDHKGPDLQEEVSDEDSATLSSQRLLRSVRNDGDEDLRKDGDGDRREDVRGGIGGVVYCYRRLSREGLLKMMAGHDVYLSAAKSDSSPVTLIEAMALGLVPVAADIPGVREWLTDESGFRYQSGDAEGLRKIIRQLAEGGDLSREGDSSFGEMRRRNRERVEREAIFEDNIAAQVRVMERLRGTVR